MLKNMTLFLTLIFTLSFKVYGGEQKSCDVILGEALVAKSPKTLKQKLYRAVISSGPVKKSLALDEIDEKLAGFRAKKGPYESVWSNILDYLEITVEVEGLENLQSTGSQLLVMNHATGPLDGIAVGHLLDTVKGIKNGKQLGNDILTKLFPELKDKLFDLNILGPKSTERIEGNQKSVNMAIEHLKAGNTLGIFPSGEVSIPAGGKNISTKEAIKNLSTVDSNWRYTAARIMLESEATVIPIFIDKKNSSLFYRLGEVRPFFRTALMMREFLKDKKKSIRLVIGQPITIKDLPKNLRPSEEDKLSKELYREKLNQISEYLKLRTYMTDGGKNTEVNKSLASDDQFYAQVRKLEQEEVAPQASKEFYQEFQSFVAKNVNKPGSPSQLISENDKFVNYLIEGNEMPQAVLEELGRSREVAFRTVGEGSGNKIDIDEFDRKYFHLIQIDKETGDISAAYRLGFADKVGGVAKTYTGKLMNIQRSFGMYLKGGVIDLGRSFVNEKYSKDNALAEVWKAFFSLLRQEEYAKYVHFLGPVSVSGDYSPLSQKLIHDYLLRYRTIKDQERVVKTINTPDPFDPNEVNDDIVSLEKLEKVGMIDKSKIKTLSAVVKLIEGSRHSEGVQFDRLPPLVESYEGMNARFITANKDNEFNTLDFLILGNIYDIPLSKFYRFSGMKKDDAEIYLNKLKEEYDVQ